MKRPMPGPVPRWVVSLLAAIMLGSSCRLGPALRQIPGTRYLPDPATTTSAGATRTGEHEKTISPGPILTTAAGSIPAPTRPPEQPVIRIPLAGPAAAAGAELSGMAWHEDTLVLLPQYPERLSERGQPGVLFALPESGILAFMDGESQDPLVPAEIPLIGPDLDKLISNYEGFEAIAFVGDRVFLTIESGRFGPMMSYLVAGTVSSGISEIHLDTSTLLSLPPRADLTNRGEEALIVSGDRLLSLFEVNGARIISNPVAYSIDPDTFAVDTVSFPNVEYRITGGTPADPDGRFWALNTFFPGDLLIFPRSDPIADRYGRVAPHSRQLAVERLLQMQIGPNGITLAEAPPVQLELLDSLQGRNWEGLAELPGRGFLLVTDRYPETILAFVPYP